MTTWALVLGGGGLAGIAWETGVLHALAEKGLDPRGAGLVVGTSAGATVAAQLASGLPVEKLFQRQADPARHTAELAPEISAEDMTVLWESLTATAEAGPEERGRTIGALAVAARTVPEAARRDIIASRLPVHEWPQWTLAITAVDAETGRLHVFDKTSGVGLVDAVTASCAVPGVWPPVTIGAARYIDGGVRTSTNADLAAGHARVLILAPMDDPALEAQVAALREQARVEVITPDDDSVVAFGLNPLDPAVRMPCALAGYAQGKREADPEGFWQ
jgi:NTE family protein